MPVLSSKADFFEQSRKRHKVIKVEAWGGKEVKLRPLSSKAAIEMAVIQQEIEGKGGDLNETQRRVVAKACILSIVDGKGDQIFSVDDIDKLLDLDHAALNEISAAILSLSGVGKEAIEAASKNSEPALN